MLNRRGFVRSALGASGLAVIAPRPYKVMAFMKDGSSRLYASR